MKAPPRKYPRQYLWVDQERFYKLIMGKVQSLKNDGFPTSTPDLTRRLAPIIEENVDFKHLFPQIKWDKKRRRRSK